MLTRRWTSAGPPRAWRPADGRTGLSAGERSAGGRRGDRRTRKVVDVERDGRAPRRSRGAAPRRRAPPGILSLRPTTPPRARSRRSLATGPRSSDLRARASTPSLRASSRNPVSGGAPEDAEISMWDTQAGRSGPLEATAHAAVYLASDEAAFVHGTVIDVDSGRGSRGDRRRLMRVEDTTGGRADGQSVHQPGTNAASPSCREPNASTSSPSGPASQDRSTSGASRSASSGASSRTSSSSLTRPDPASTT